MILLYLTLVLVAFVAGFWLGLAAGWQGSERTRAERAEEARRVFRERTRGPWPTEAERADVRRLLEEIE